MHILRLYIKNIRCWHFHQLGIAIQISASARFADIVHLQLLSASPRTSAVTLPARCLPSSPPLSALATSSSSNMPSSPSPNQSLPDEFPPPFPFKALMDLSHPLATSGASPCIVSFSLHPWPNLQTFYMPPSLSVCGISPLHFGSLHATPSLHSCSAAYLPCILLCVGW